MLTNLLLAFIALFAVGFGLFLGVLIRKAWRLGLVRIRGMTLDKEKQPRLFLFLLVIYGLVGILFVIFGIFLAVMLALYGI